MTASDLRDQLVTTLTRIGGGNRRRWRTTVGEIKVYSTATHPHCNWSVAPSGSISDVAMVECLVDDFRLRYPIISAG